MKINITFLSLPKVTKIIGSKSILFNFSGQTINDLLNELVKKYGIELGQFLLDDSGKLDSIFKVLLNEKQWISRDQMNKTLEAGDQVTFMMLVGGG
ncbi:MAG: MoaD/ThiS family protein [Candidatus Aminicenantes bacterium]|jgi:molybdopterin converting factor small subunit|nr:MoaD/ThiS family protein [Candidatus Aminicenantes bacterium]